MLDSKKFRLYFADGEVIDAVDLGIVQLSGVKYRVFLDSEEKDIYIYRYLRLADDKFKLEYIANKDEFRNICERINSKFAEGGILQ